MIFLTITRKRFLRAAHKTILVTALLHVAVLIALALRTGNIFVLNYFDIIDLNQFMPAVADGLAPFAASFLFLTGIFFFMFFLS